MPIYNNLSLVLCPFLCYLGLACELSNPASSRGWAHGKACGREVTPAGHIASHKDPPGDKLCTPNSVGPHPGPPLALPQEGVRECVYSLCRKVVESPTEQLWPSSDVRASLRRLGSQEAPSWGELVIKIWTRQQMSFQYSYLAAR